MAECARLESGYTLTGIASSNLASSAKIEIKIKVLVNKANKGPFIVLHRTK